MLTEDQLHQLLPRCAQPQDWVQALNSAMTRYQINTPVRLAAFLAQVGHESGQLNSLVENLNYKTAQRLMQVWPKRFPTPAAAQPYVNNEKKLASLVYANRLGNGDAASGDGYTFRGRGLIQITGRSNYAAAAQALGVDLLGQPDLLLQKEHAALSAAWFWSEHGLNVLADAQTQSKSQAPFSDITRRINGGTTDLAARWALFEAAQTVLG